MKDFNKACEELIANGGKKIENLKIKDVDFKFEDSYVYFRIKLNRVINKQFGIKGSKIVHTSNYALLVAMRRNINCNEFIAWYDTITDKETTCLALANELKNIHNHIDIIQQHVKLSEDGLAHYTNPFNDNEHVFEQPVVLNYIVNIY